MMNAIPDGWKVVRCAVCREPVNQWVSADGRTVSRCARCVTLTPERAERMSRIRSAALAARVRRSRA
jgi:hypothetical protein